MSLRLTNVVKTYPGVLALAGVSLDVKDGEVHAVLGENGAGKSTLMGVAAGSVRPDEGSVSLDGHGVRSGHPQDARRRGLSIVYQTPALSPSLTVRDALFYAHRPRLGRKSRTAWATELLSEFDVQLDPASSIGSLSLREAHLLEIASSLADRPKVLVLDEPTEALGPDERVWLFEHVRALAARGSSVVYITHRIPEVQELADNITILRGGRVVASVPGRSLTDDEIVTLIVGRSLEMAFPPKPGSVGPERLAVEHFSGPGFSDVSLQAHGGEVLGLAGIEGHGQREVLRSLAGVAPASGRYRLEGKELTPVTPPVLLDHGVQYLAGDRLNEGLFAELSVRENVSISTLDRFANGVSLVSGTRERAAVADVTERMDVRTPSLDIAVSSLSGGNQQKALLSRAVLTDSAVLLVEDPTQGVDPGARLEIYRTLRDRANGGAAVVVLSTDAVELNGLCDRVVVFSQGRPVAELVGDAITEEAITGSALRAEHRGTGAESSTTLPAGRRSGSRAWLNILALLAVTAAIFAFTGSRSPAFLTQASLAQLAVTAATLLLVTVGQLTVVISAGIDLSVGSVVALGGVLFSFWADRPFGIATVTGVAVVLLMTAVVGAVNAGLIVLLKLPPVVATLVTSIAVAGVALLLRPTPDGQMDDSVSAMLSSTMAGIPSLFVVAVVLVGLGQWALSRRWGIELRAVGSDEAKATRMGASVPRVRLGAYVVSSVCAGIAGISLYSQTGIGDATTGQPLTLLSVTAVVLGGASIFGGSGTYVGAAVAAFLLATITAAFTFLSAGLAWQYALPGLLVLLAGAIYARRGRSSWAT